MAWNENVHTRTRSAKKTKQVRSAAAAENPETPLTEQGSPVTSASEIQKMITIRFARCAIRKILNLSGESGCTLLADS
jgi:hypothetical protein